MPPRTPRSASAAMPRPAGGRARMAARPPLAILAVRLPPDASKGPPMPIISPEDLSALIAALDDSDAESRDELLTDLLVAAYPTRVTQDC